MPVSFYVKIEVFCYLSFSSLVVKAKHRIIDDRIEKSIKGRRIGHCVFFRKYI